jgi:predicted dehydrogenase
MKKIRTAVVGVGHLGQHHARWYNNIEQSDLIGIYDIDSDKCQQIANDLKVKAFTDLSELESSVEAVSVVVPTAKHYEVASRMIKKGIHCLIEKPITATYEQAQEIIKLAGEAKVTVSVGHIERFNPAVSALRDFDIRPRFIEAHRLAAFNPRGADVAVVLDLMSHDIELALHMIKSKIRRIDASAVAVISDTTDIANARLTFENGAVANLTASRISLKPMRKLRIFQRSGYYSLDLAEKQADIYRLAHDCPPDTTGFKVPLGESGHEVIYNKVSGKDEDMLQLELTSFINALISGKQPEVSAADGAETLRVAIEINRVGINETSL